MQLARRSLIPGSPPLLAVMDTLAALALATEDPYPELLDDPPHGRNESLITGLMWLHIVVSSMYKLFW